MLKMAELGIERHHTLTHSELTYGHDVSQLLSHINQNFKQSKADQILRLLHDQDKINEQLNDSELVEKEYNQIREEKVICDSDTLTDSSSDDEETIQLEEEKEDQHANNRNESRVRYKSARCRTSMGFRNNGDIDTSTMDETDTVFDTRDITLRPKSSYVRRSAYRKREDEANIENVIDNSDDFVESNQRMAKSAKAVRQRPKSRLGRSSVQRTERKIALVEANDVTVVPDEPVVQTKEDLVTGAYRSSYDRFARLRTPKRESNRTKPQFCATTGGSHQQTEEDMSVDTSCGSNSMDIREDIIEIQPSDTQTTRKYSQNTNAPGFSNNTVPRNSPVQSRSNKLQYAPVRQGINQTYHEPQVEYNSHNSQCMQERTDAAFNHVSAMRADAGNRPDVGSMRSDATHMRPEYNVLNGNVSVKRTDSNTSNSRPKNPEPIHSRPMEGRPTTRRRLQRRYMAQTQTPMANMRPTSESVILARQRTEKNLLKKQQENRPHSEKMPLTSGNKNILSVNENPAQGPQTLLTSKAGIQQSSHVQSNGFRGYGNGSRLNSSTMKRELKGELSLPRPGPNNAMLGGRKSIAALMKLPPLEASLAAKKKERGLALAARETCV